MEVRLVTFSDESRICAIGQGTWNMGRNPSVRKEETAALLSRHRNGNDDG